MITVIIFDRDFNSFSCSKSSPFCSLLQIHPPLTIEHTQEVEIGAQLVIKVKSEEPQKLKLEPWNKPLT